MYESGPLHTIKSIVQNRKALRNQNLTKFGILATFSLSSSSTMSSSPPPSKPGHSRHETALIHGLSQSEVQKLSEACVEAKSRAYCQLHPYLYPGTAKLTTHDFRPIFTLSSRMLDPPRQWRYSPGRECRERGVPSRNLR